jgi:hypothetical protein
MKKLAALQQICHGKRAEELAPGKYFVRMKHSNTVEIEVVR